MNEAGLAEGALTGSEVGAIERCLQEDSEGRPAHMGSRYLLEQMAEGGKREYEDEINE